MSREHGKGGKYIEMIPPERILGVFDMVDRPVILSTDVADALDCSGETARRKLQQLHEQGELKRRKVSRRVIYWRVEESDAFDTANLRGDPETTLTADSDEGDAKANVDDDATERLGNPPTDAHCEHTAVEEER